MNAPLQPYRIVLDYEALEDAFLDRIEDLNTTFEQIDVAAGFTRGNTQKLLSKSRERWARTFGVESLGKMLKGTGLAIVLVLDDERFQAIKDELVKRRRRRGPVANATSRKPAWLFTRKKAREMGKRRFSLMSDLQKERLWRKAGKASGRARRRKARQKAGALMNLQTSAPCMNGHSPSDA